MIGQRDGTARRREEHRSGNEFLRRRAGKILCARRALGHGDITRRLHEGGELCVGHFRRVHPEAVHRDAMHGTRVGRRLHADRIVHVRRILRAHREFPTGNPHHAIGRGPGGASLVFDGWKET